MKSRLTCNYSVIRFLPYPEAGEFVNVGVVVHSPMTGFFDYRLLDGRKTSRVGGFFPELRIEHYRDAVKNCGLELERMSAEIGIRGKNAQQLAIDPSMGLALFRELVRPRETVMRFSSPGSALTDEPTALLGELFDRYVLRMFAAETEYQEEIMQRHIATTLRRHKLITQFRDATLGNEDYHVHFPFVYQPRIGRFAGAIKPLNLAQDQSTKIYDHGEMWVNRVRRLQRIAKAPEKMLFLTHRPAADEKRRFAASAEVCLELERLDITVVPEDDECEMLKFARRVASEGSGELLRQLPPIRTTALRGFGIDRRHSSQPASTFQLEATHTALPDKSQINPQEPAELRYWMERLGASRDEIERAICKVGPLADDVKRELGK